MSIKWKFGCDPEVFLEDAKTKEFYGAWRTKDVVKGTKAKPEPTKYGGIQIDGFALEFNTHPANTPEELSDYVQQALADIADRFPDKRISTSSHVKFTPHEWQMIPAEAKKIGCDPDYVSYNVKPGQLYPYHHRMGQANAVRCAGGHIHVGFTDGVDPRDIQHVSLCQQAVQQLDAIVGTYCNKHDTKGHDRRFYVGERGYYRPKHYGFEYRVPSNFWIFDPKMTKDIIQLVHVSMELLRDMGNPLQKPATYAYKRDIWLANIERKMKELGYDTPKGVLDIGRRSTAAR